MRPGAFRGAGIAVGVVATFAPALSGQADVYRVMALFFLSMGVLAGLYLITGLGRMVSLCHASLVGVGAYAGALVSLRTDVSPVLSLAAGVVAAGIASLALAWLTRALEDHYLAFATLAFGEIVSNVFRGATSVTGGANGLVGIPPLAAFGVEFDAPSRYYWICVLAGLTALLVVHLFDRSLTGRALRAYGDQGRRVESLGVGVPTLRVLAFTVGGAIAGLIGAIQAHIDGFVGPESFGAALSIAYLCFLVVGGLASARTVVIAAVFASLAPELLRGLLAWQMVIVAIAAILVLRLRVDLVTGVAALALRTRSVSSSVARVAESRSREPQ